MSYNDRIIILERFQRNNEYKLNKLKLVETGDHIQVWVKANRSVSMRLDKAAVVRLKAFLDKVELK